MFGNNDRHSLYLVLLGCAYVTAIRIAESRDYYEGFVVGLIVHDFLDGLSQSSSGHCREFTRHPGDNNLSDHCDLSGNNLWLPLIR